MDIVAVWYEWCKEAGLVKNLCGGGTISNIQCSRAQRVHRAQCYGSE